MIKAILFDFDGTIADALPVLLKIVNKMSKKYGYHKVEKNQIDELKNHSIRQALKEDAKMSFYKIPFFMNDVRKELKKKREEVKIFPGVKPLLLELSKDYWIGIITKNSKTNVDCFLKKYNIDYIDLIVTDTSMYKKHHAIKKALQKLKIKNSEAIYVGDEIRDILACKKIKVKIISVTWGFNSKKALLKEKPNYIVDRPKDILEIVKSKKPIL
jgi:phosphoglycolate phosphatase